jgi:predicted transcriptional regulator
MPLTPELEGTIPALVKADLKQKVVSNTCERCSIANCAERAAPPVVANLREKRKNVGETINELQRKARLAARRRL